MYKVNYIAVHCGSSSELEENDITEDITYSDIKISNRQHKLIRGSRGTVLCPLYVFDLIVKVKKVKWNVIHIDIFKINITVS